jgi:DNA-binding GntR family transcriptional regulator
MRIDSTTKAYTFIRNKILDGTYAPGTSLSANALSAEVGVSRTPVHDALRQLETDGLVVIRPKVGAMVKFMNLKDFKELCWMRKVLESNAAGLAASEHTEDDLMELGRAHAEMLDIANGASETDLRHPSDELKSALARVDIRFHVAVMNAAHNELLKTEIVRLRLINRVVGGITPLYIHEIPDYLEETHKTLGEHQRIYDAITLRDAKEATASMEAHIQDILDHSIKRMRGEEASQMTALGI